MEIEYKWIFCTL